MKLVLTTNIMYMHFFIECGNNFIEIDMDGEGCIYGITFIFYPV